MSQQIDYRVINCNKLAARVRACTRPMLIPKPGSMWAPWSPRPAITWSTGELKRICQADASLLITAALSLVACFVAEEPPGEHKDQESPEDTLTLQIRGIQPGRLRVMQARVALTPQAEGNVDWCGGRVKAPSLEAGEALVFDGNAAYYRVQPNSTEQRRETLVLVWVTEKALARGLIRRSIQQTFGDTAMLESALTKLAH